MRGMYGSVADWPRMYQQVMLYGVRSSIGFSTLTDNRHLKPGGWFEQTEISVVPKSDDGTVADDSIFAKWGRVSLEAGDAFGKSLRIVDESKDLMVAAGFEDVIEHRYKLPLTGWSEDPRLKEIGRYNKLHWELGLEGGCLFLLINYLHWSREEVMGYIAQMRQMLRDKSVHAYHEW